MRRWSRTRGLGRAARFATAVAITLGLYSVIAFGFVLAGKVALDRHLGPTGGYRRAGPFPLPDAVTIEGSSGTCDRTCQRLLTDGRAAYVESIAEDGVRRYRLLRGHVACAGARALVESRYPHLGAALPVQVILGNDLAVAYDLCLAMETDRVSRAPVLIRHLSFPDIRSPTRYEIWRGTDGGDRRLVVSAQGGGAYGPSLPPRFAVPFQTHGFGADLIAQRMWFRIAVPDDRQVFIDTFGVDPGGLFDPVPLPPIADPVPILLGNLSGGPEVGRRAVYGLRPYLKPGADLDPTWLAPILAVLPQVTDDHLLFNILPLLAPFGRAARAAAPTLYAALGSPDAGVRREALRVGRAIALFTPADAARLRQIAADDPEATVRTEADQALATVAAP